MHEQRDTSVPRKHHPDYRDRSNWGTTKSRVVYSFNSSVAPQVLFNSSAAPQVLLPV